MENKNDYLQILLKIHSISRIGLLYSKDPYALENYEEIRKITMSAIENFNNLSFERPLYFERDIYPTPNLSTRTIIFNEKHELLMVQEAKNGLWSLPGGWIDLYDSPSEGAKKECLQEAGAEVEIINLLGIKDVSQYSSSKLSEFVIVFEGRLKSFVQEHCHETSDVKFFPLDKLPPLSNKLYKEVMDAFLTALEKKETIFD